MNLLLAHSSENSVHVRNVRFTSAVGVPGSHDDEPARTVT